MYLLCDGESGHKYFWDFMDTDDSAAINDI